MNTKIISTVFTISLLSLFFGCSKDNYDAPESVLSGRVVYQGEALNLRGSKEQVRLQLYQDGYAKRDAIEVFVGQDGTFSATLFDGRYKMVTRDANGPWVNSRDTTVVDVKGNTSMDLNVTPYFTISNSSVSIENNTMRTSFTINKIVSTAVIDRVILLLNTTAFVDDEYQVMRKDFTDNLTTGTVNFTADLVGNTKVQNATALYGRVCVWTSGADQGIYSPVVRLK